MKSMLRRLRKFASLTGSERGLLLEAWFQTAAVRLALWVLPFRVARRLRWVKTPLLSRISIPERVAWAVAVAGRYVPKATCLVKALAGQALLARRGHAARLCIGVAKPEGRLEAHAWLEWEGQVLLGGSELDRYAGLVEWESGIAARS